MVQWYWRFICSRYTSEDMFSHPILLTTCASFKAPESIFKDARPLNLRGSYFFHLFFFKPSTYRPLVDCGTVRNYSRRAVPWSSLSTRPHRVICYVWNCKELALFESLAYVRRACHLAISNGVQWYLLKIIISFPCESRKAAFSASGFLKNFRLSIP